MSERLLKTLRNSGDFQAEYEGSIPFWRALHQRLQIHHHDAFVSGDRRKKSDNSCGTNAPDSFVDVSRLRREQGQGLWIVNNAVDVPAQAVAGEDHEGVPRRAPSSAQACLAA